MNPATDRIYVANRSPNSIDDTVSVIAYTSNEVVWIDVNCDGKTDAVDALMELRYVAGLSVTKTESCPDIGSEVEVADGALATTRGWGDADCDGDVDAVDALLILRIVAGLAVALPPDCPLIG
ncbi:MAG: hypothetical protein V3S00_04190 [Dehalococcoidia bacterium]